MTVVSGSTKATEQVLCASTPNSTGSGHCLFTSTSRGLQAHPRPSRWSGPSRCSKCLISTERWTHSARPANSRDRTVRTSPTWPREAHENLRTLSRMGRRVAGHAGVPGTGPVAGATGNAPLAERADGELPFSETPLRAYTTNTHTSRGALPTDLAEVRARVVTRSTGRSRWPGSPGSGSTRARRHLPSTRSVAQCQSPGSPGAVMQQTRSKIESALLLHGRERRSGRPQPGDASIRSRTRGTQRSRQCTRDAPRAALSSSTRCSSGPTHMRPNAVEADPDPRRQRRPGGCPCRSDGPPRHPTGRRLCQRGRYRPVPVAVLEEFALPDRAIAPSTRRAATIRPGVVPAMARNSRFRWA